MAGGDGMDEDLETRVSRQFSSLYLTLVSVMVGLVLSDLFSAVHECGTRLTSNVRIFDSVFRFLWLR